MTHPRHGSGGQAHRCTVQESGVIELYFYDELDAAERARIGEHVRECRVCAAALDDLATIRAALAQRPSVDAPEGGDWSGFMTRLDTAVRSSQPSVIQMASRVATLPPPRTAARPYIGLLATAALLAIVTIGVFVARQRTLLPDAPETVSNVPAAAETVPIATSGMRSTGEKHFERSKLVVLGLAARESAETSAADWAYERELATSLLNDTRLYRMAAEERGMNALAGVMRDLELVLVETSMAEETDPVALEQIQRLIRRRGLIQKMETVASAGM